LGQAAAGSGRRSPNSQTTTPQQREGKCHHTREFLRVGGRAKLPITSGTAWKRPSQLPQSPRTTTVVPQGNSEKLPHTSPPTEKGQARRRPDSTNRKTAPSKRGKKREERAQRKTDDQGRRLSPKRGVCGVRGCPEGYWSRNARPRSASIKGTTALGKPPGAHCACLTSYCWAPP